MDCALPALAWSYEMRREMQEIIPKLFLGPYAAAAKSQLDALKEHGITHILCVRSRCENNVVHMNFPDHFRYLELNIDDSRMATIIPFISQAKVFIDECFSSGGAVLVHGNAGICRSAALVIGYLMETYIINYSEAQNYVLNRRLCISPRIEFVRQLHEYEFICEARRSFPQLAAGSQLNDSKRKTEDEEGEIEGSEKQMKGIEEGCMALDNDDVMQTEE